VGVAEGGVSCWLLVAEWLLVAAARNAPLLRPPAARNNSQHTAGWLFSAMW
jgi:type IV secretory pathway TrbD component